MTKNDLVVVLASGDTFTVTFEHQPTTDDIAATIWRKTERYVIQWIGGDYYVYATKTVKQQFGRAMIGMPVFVTKDEDAAIMWAVLHV